MKPIVAVRRGLGEFAHSRAGIPRLIGVLAVAAAAAVFAGTAAASQPTITPFTFAGTSQFTGACSFPVSVHFAQTGTEIDFVDGSGALTRIDLQTVEQDTFSANGKTLTGLSFTFNFEVLFDTSGNITHEIGDGIVERVVLPDGSLFLAAGRADFINHPGVNFLLTPDQGTPVDVAAFCAALSP